MRYFSRHRWGIKFIVNWHHHLVADALDKVISGEIENLALSLPPGGTKTEAAVINFIARGLALNPRARFLHLSGSDTLAQLNSATARDLVQSDEYQAFWPLKVAEDAKSKKRWNVMDGGRMAGGVYATSIGGQVTGFRAGHMAPGFQGAIIIDDPIKPDDVFKKTEVAKANRKLLTTIKSRKANPATPMVVIMQRVAENDPIGFIEGKNVPGKWTFIRIPAVLDQAYIDALPEKYRKLIDLSNPFENRFSYWPYKEPLEELLKMERGDGQDAEGNKVSRHVFASQYQQTPRALGGNIIKGSDFVRYTVLPKIKYRMIFGDTAQKTKERNDYSVFEEWGYGVDGRLYLLALDRGRWEAPELQRRAIAFWARAKARDTEFFGQVRKMAIEDKVSGTGLIQTLRIPPHNIPVLEIPRTIDKLTRCMDALPYIEAHQVCIPENEPYTADFVTEAEAFSSDDTHAFDDQLDPMFDAIQTMLSSQNKVKIWEKLGERDNANDAKPATPYMQLMQRLRPGATSL